MTVDTKPAWQFLPEMTDAQFRDLKESIATQGFWPDQAVVLDRRGRILDGHHRARACAELGIDVPTRTIDRDLTDKQAWDYVYLANVTRRHLTVEQRRGLVREWLRRHPETSDREAAKATGVSDKTVGAIREVMVASAEIPQTTVAHQRTDQLERFLRCDLCLDPVERLQSYRREDRQGHKRCFAAEDADQPQADHRRMCWAEVTINYPVPSDQERTRAGLPYPRESDRREWTTNRMYLQSAVPTTATEAAQMLVELTNRITREMNGRPLLTMRLP